MLHGGGYFIQSGGCPQVGSPQARELTIYHMRGFAMFEKLHALSFATLRCANTERLPQFRNKLGGLAHSQPDGSDWTPAQWLQAVVGELGEYANIRKKFERGDIGLDEYAELAAKELADVQTYLDILARRCLDIPGTPHPEGVDLGAATVAKFNEVSERVGSSIRIAPLIHQDFWWDTSDGITPVTA